MTLADLLPQTVTYETAKDLALIFSPELAAQFSAVQALHGHPRFIVEPVDLVDGRKMLCADLLTEVGPGGIYSGGFAHLPAELFPLVEVLPMAAVLPLLPQPEEI
jgi:hypothetical protein